MGSNPLATADQRAVEDAALRLIERPELQRARMIAAMLWKNACAWPKRDQMSSFDNMIDEYIFHHAFRGANGDGAYPKIARFMVPAHHWFGRTVPGSRWAGDSPDFVYRTIPISHGGRYEIHGKPSCVEPPTVNYSLMADSTAAPVTQYLVDSLDMEFAVDGSFTITVDGTSADGRPNHIQTRPGADFIMIRDALGDWMNQSANALTVKRLNASGGDPLSDEDMARHAAKIAIEGVYYSFYCTMSGAGQPLNEVRPPQSSGAFGGMATQWGTKGNLCLEADEALIITLNSAGAQFRNVTLTDAFHMSVEYWKRTSSFNHLQMAPDADGNYTFVVAHSDPGVHNWLDNGGKREVIFGTRWQAFGSDGASETPMVSARKVRLSDLESELPGGVARIDAAGRAEQIAAREAGFRRRFVEG